MAKKKLLISDTHFTHHAMYHFTNDDGTRVRPEFATAEEADEAMVERWNSVVSPTSTVYHLGDVFINRKYRFILDRLHGDKVLIKGNHDIFDLSNYTPFFRDIRAYHVLDRCILSHVPIHRDSIARFKGNIHGHLHSNRVRTADGNIDPAYFSVCVEHINYTPILFDEVIARLEAQT
jgi:calcineurin-like phosphoesterase family protein